MREALRGLTTRGRAFLAAGLTAVVCAVVLDQRPLIQVGVLLVALPLVTAFVVGRGRYRLALTRTVEPRLTAAGQSARVDIALTNEGWIPTGTLLLEEFLPYSLGSRPRFVVRRIGQGWRQTVTYTVRSDVRGRFEIGPMTVRVADPFGMVELGRTFRATTPLIVTPPVESLSTVTLTGTQSATGDSRPREFAGGSAEDVTVREYRRGDDLRRVHWRSSARLGELMVRREEQPWQARATVFLDNRKHVHRGTGAGSSFESAVAAAASIGVHLARRGFTVRLVTSSGGSTNAWHSREGDTDLNGLLEELALVQLAPSGGVDGSWIGEGNGGLTVAVLGAVDQADVAVLRRARHHAGTALAIALDVEEWVARGRVVRPRGRTGHTAGHSDVRAGLALLTTHGWRAAALAPEQHLDEVWRGFVSAAGRPAYHPPVAAAGTEGR